MKIKAIIFDMDGLLIDSEILWQEAEVKVFTEIGASMTKEMTQETMGLRINEIVDHWFSYFSLAVPPKKEVEARLVEEVVSLIKKKGVPCRGAKDIIKLFAAKKIPTAIASSSQIKIIDAALEKISVREYIKIIHSAEYELYGKPHPAVYMTTAKKLKVAVENCLTFEDSPNGLLAAKAAKMKCIAVPNQISKDDKRFCIADMIIDSLKDFRLEYLDQF